MLEYAVEGFLQVHKAKIQKEVVFSSYLQELVHSMNFIHYRKALPESCLFYGNILCIYTVLINLYIMYI